MLENNSTNDREIDFNGIKDLIEAFWKPSTNHLSLVGGMRAVFLPLETLHQVYSRHQSNIFFSFT